MPSSTRNKKRDSYVAPAMDADPEKILRDARRKAGKGVGKNKKAAGTGNAKVKKPSKKGKGKAKNVERIEEEEEPVSRDEEAGEDATADLPLETLVKEADEMTATQEPAPQIEETTNTATTDLRQATPVEEAVQTTAEEPAALAEETNSDAPTDLPRATTSDEVFERTAAEEPVSQSQNTTDAPIDVAQATPEVETAERLTAEEPALHPEATTDAAAKLQQAITAEESAEATALEKPALQAEDAPINQLQTTTAEETTETNDSQGRALHIEGASTDLNLPGTTEETAETTPAEQAAADPSLRSQETRHAPTDLEQATAVREAAEKTLQQHEAEKRSEKERVEKKRHRNPDKETTAERIAREAETARELKEMDVDYALEAQAEGENAGIDALVAEAVALQAAKSEAAALLAARSEASGTKRPAEKQPTSDAANKRQRTEHQPTNDAEMATNDSEIPHQYQQIMEETQKPQTTKKRLSESEFNDGNTWKRQKYERQNPCEVFAKKLADWQSKLTKPLIGPASVGRHIALDTIFQALASVSEAVNDYRVAKKRAPFYGLLHPKSMTEPDGETHPIVRPRTDALVPLQRSSVKRVHYSLLVLRKVSEDPQAFVGDHCDSNRSLRSAFENTMPPKANARKAILGSGWAGDKKNDDEEDKEILGAIKSIDSVCDIPAGYDWVAGLHTILNGWVCIFCLEHNKTPRLDDDFYAKAVQVVNLALRGLMDSAGIINFLQCYEYVKIDENNDQPEWLKQDRRFLNTKPFLTPESLDDHILKSTGRREWQRRAGRANRAAPAPKRERPGQHNQHVEEEKEGDDNLTPAERFPKDFLSQFLPDVPDTSSAPPSAGLMQEHDESRRKSNPFLNKAPEYEPEDLGSDYADSLEGDDWAEDLRNRVGADGDDEDEDEDATKETRTAREASPSPERFDWRGRAIPKKAKTIDDLDDLFDANQEVDFGDDGDDEKDEEGQDLAGDDEDENGPTNWGGQDYYGGENDGGYGNDYGDGNGDDYDENAEDDYDELYGY